MIEPRLNVVLVEPEIPQNTGSVGRLCLGSASTLHLVKPYGFEISHSRLRRAGLDYWEHVKLVEHESLEAFCEFMPPDAPKALFSVHAGKIYFDVEYVPGMFLFFGKETKGLPEWFLNRYASDAVRIPVFDAKCRGFNLATAVGMGIYEAIRQISFSSE